jgi:hypothetical protein
MICSGVCRRRLDPIAPIVLLADKWAVRLSKRPDRTQRVTAHGLTAWQLDALDGVVTGCALAIAESGTLVLAGGSADGRQALTLVPDRHVCIVMAPQVVETVSEAFDALRSVARRPLTFVSDPSATSDIELERVQGVHGPRTLIVLIVEEERRRSAPVSSLASSPNASTNTSRLTAPCGRRTRSKTMSEVGIRPLRSRVSVCHAGRAGSPPRLMDPLRRRPVSSPSTAG